MTTETVAGTASQLKAKRNRRRRLKGVGLSHVFLGVVGLAALTAPLLPLDPNRQDLTQRLAAPFASGFSDFSMILGGDALGRSTLARLIYGSQVSLSVGLISAGLALVVGALIGVAAGVWRGRFEDLAMRFVDMWMSMPTLLVALLILYVLGPGLWNLVIVLALLRWMVFARVARALTLSVMQKQFIEVTHAVGCSKPRILFRHVLPNIKWDLLSLWSLEVALAMLTEAGLSFLGLGIQPPDSSWGSMLAEGRQYLSSSPWLVFFPGLMVMLTALCINVAVDRRRSSTSTGSDVWQSVG